MSFILESLQWDESTRTRLLSQSLGKTRCALSTAFSQRQLCSGFCGGKHCIYCRPYLSPSMRETAIPGLRATWQVYAFDNLIFLNFPGSIQTLLQVQSCQQFEQFIAPFYVIFDVKSNPFTLTAFLKRQHNLLHGIERKRLRNIPRVSLPFLNIALHSVAFPHKKNMITYLKPRPFTRFGASRIFYDIR
ncbi:hypothetical protein D915_009900 [Fasciola hepatica]|uniref:Uncharacterized protein n=1 Tax=Fasciola hepatica TaxID=6192 RepID=A0A4E0QWJ4_FASHE|nr:hypothetical protein D915_009900 [Fasciola hepatica]